MKKIKLLSAIAVLLIVTTLASCEKLTSAEMASARSTNLTNGFSKYELEVNWEVADQINVSHYVIQASSDAVAFSDIGIQFSDSMLTGKYHFKRDVTQLFADTIPVLYVRVRCIDYNQSSSYTQIEALRK